jgi:hypothetical protein
MRHKDISSILEVRFGTVPEEILSALKAIQDEAKLHRLVRVAAGCDSLEVFRHEMES